MGNYATSAELKTRFADDTEVAFLTDSAPTPDEAVITDVLEAAEASIDTRIGKRYKTPVASTDTGVIALMKRMTLDLSEVFLLQRGRTIGEDKEKQMDRVLEWADRIADGTYVLPGASTWDSTVSRNPVASYSDSTRTLDDGVGRVVTRETMARL